MRYMLVYFQICLTFQVKICFNNC